MDVTGERTEGNNTNNNNKNTTPLFPRIHVNDTKIIGSRAPPRNKMALYDQQLSISSQKLINTHSSSSSSSSSSTLLANANGLMHTNTPSSSSQCVIGTKRSLFSPYKSSSASFHSNLKQPLHWIDEIEDSTSANFTKTSTLITNSNEIVNVTPLPINLQCSSPVAPNSLDHQFRPAILHKDEAAAFLPPQMKSDSLREFVSAVESCTLELQTNNAANEVRPLFMSIGHLESDGLKVVPETSARNDTKLSPISEARESELNETDTNKSGGHHLMDVSTQQEKEIRRGDDATSYDEEQKVSIVNNASNVMRNESCHETTVITDMGQQTLNNVENGNNQVGVKGQKDYSSAPRSSSISSEAVIKMIGLEDFQKARNAMIHQQRVFSMQVFELHKLIRVQKQIAGSGNRQHNKEFVHHHLGEELVEPKAIPEAPPWHGKSRNGNATKKLTGTADKKPSSLSFSSLSSEVFRLAAKTESDFRKLTNLPAADFPITWPYLRPPENQWLLPVISPSEGLVYKPYTPPTPPPHPLPPGGFLGPTVYNNDIAAGHHNPTTKSRNDYLNLACGVSGTTPTPPVGSTYFTPYGMHISNNPYNNNFGATSLHQSSSSNVGEAINKEGEKMEIRTIKKIVSSNDILPLFPTSPTSSSSSSSHDLVQTTTTQSSSNEPMTQVIKVVPRNPKYARESAGRILKIIQEERTKSFL